MTYYNDFRIEPSVTIQDSRSLWPIHITMINITVGPWTYPSEYWVNATSHDALHSLDPRLPTFWNNHRPFVAAIWNTIPISIDARSGTALRNDHEYCLIL